MTDKPMIPPALTLEEWEGVRDEGRRESMLSVAGDGVLKGTESESYHAAEGLALYGQPFGVKQEWASVLDGIPRRELEPDEDRVLCEVSAFLRALLPPDPETLRQQLEDDALRQARGGG